MTKRVFYLFLLIGQINESIGATNEILKPTQDTKMIEVVEEEKEFYLIKQPVNDIDELERYSLSELVDDIYKD
ncbi:MAG: hypothetical protein H6622_06905 [Halobacteriovoraceae bacterium]|nr:hypothetical protein [Halobacteriovoraceae bacterium]